MAVSDKSCGRSACCVLSFGGLALYALLKPVNKNLALLFLLLNLGGVAVRFAIDINYVAVLQLLSGADTVKVFQADQLQACMTFLHLQKNGYWASQIFFGAWLFH